MVEDGVFGLGDFVALHAHGSTTHCRRVCGGVQVVCVYSPVYTYVCDGDVHGTFSDTSAGGSGLKYVVHRYHSSGCLLLGHII